MNAAIRVLPSAGLREMPRREVRIDAPEGDAAAIAACLIQDGWQAERRPG